MDTLLSLSLGVALISLVLTLVSHVSVLVVCARVRRPDPGSARARGISVLKPLKGDEPGLYENLASIARQRYPKFEILFGCADASDPALDVARQVQRDFPDVPMRVFSGCPNSGRNPKVNNLRMLSARARYDCVLVSDANIRASEDYLAAMAAELDDPRVGLVSSVLVAEGERTLGALFDNLHMNSGIVRGVCGAAVTAGHPCVVGKSMLFRSSDLERLGGYSLVDDVLAEDYVLGRTFRDAGYGVVLSAHRLSAMTVNRTLKDFVARHVRWSQMRRHLLPSIYLFEPLESPIPWLLLALGCVLCGGAGEESRAAVLLALGAGLALRLASDGALARRLRGTRLGLRDYLAIPVKDLLMVGIWAVGGVKRSVNWRGTRLRIAKGSRLLPLGTPEGARTAFERA